MALSDNISVVLECNEASGDFLDATGNGRTFTDNNSCGTDGAGARTFNGSNQTATRADEAAISSDGTDFSIAIWVNADSSTNYHVASKMGSFPYFEWFIKRQFTGSDNRLAFVTVNNGGTPIGTVHAENYGNTPTATWICIIATYTYATRGMTISVNAGTRDTATASADITAGLSDLGVGRSDTAFFAGKVGQFAFWKRALTTGDETQFYNGGTVLSYSSWGGGGSPAAQTSSPFSSGIIIGGSLSRTGIKTNSNL